MARVCDRHGIEKVRGPNGRDASGRQKFKWRCPSCHQARCAEYNKGVLGHAPVGSVRWRECGDCGYAFSFIQKRGASRRFCDSCRDARKRDTEVRSRDGRAARGAGRWSYRRFKGDSCERCGFVPVHPCQLDAHHRNHDHSDNRRENIETLCANCHRLEHHAPEKLLAAA